MNQLAILTNRERVTDMVIEAKTLRRILSKSFSNPWDPTGSNQKLLSPKSNLLSTWQAHLIKLQFAANNKLGTQNPEKVVTLFNSVVLFTNTGYLQDLGRMRINRSLLWNYFDTEAYILLSNLAGHCRYKNIDEIV